MLPQRLAGRDLFWWLTRLGLLRVTVTSGPGRRMSRRDFVIGTNRKRLERAGVGSGPAGRRRGPHGPLRRPPPAGGRGVVVWATGYRPDYAWIDLPRWSVKARSCTGGA